MSRVDSVGTNVYYNHPIAAFGPISGGVAGGIVTGYAAKYLIPLTDVEKGPNYNRHIAAIRESANKAKGIVVDEIRKLPEKTPAQDLFIKVIDIKADADKIERPDFFVRRNRFSEEDNKALNSLLDSYKKGGEAGEAVVNSLRTAENKTPVQKLFLEIVDSDKAVKKHANAIRKAFRESNLTEESKNEFKNLIEQVNNKGKMTFKQLVAMYNSGLKRVKRPALSFMTAGAAVGLFAGVLHKAFIHNEFN